MKILVGLRCDFVVDFGVDIYLLNDDVIIQRRADSEPRIMGGIQEIVEIVEVEDEKLPADLKRLNYHYSDNQFIKSYYKEDYINFVDGVLKTFN